MLHYLARLADRDDIAWQHRPAKAVSSFTRFQVLTRLWQIVSCEMVSWMAVIALQRTLLYLCFSHSPETNASTTKGIKVNVYGLCILKLETWTRKSAYIRVNCLPTRVCSREQKVTQFFGEAYCKAAIMAQQCSLVSISVFWGFKPNFWWNRYIYSTYLLHQQTVI